MGMWDAIATGIKDWGPTFAAIGSGFLGGDDKSSVNYTGEFRQNPEYPETTGARESWWDKVSQWGSEEGYGAIAPDWTDIWDTANKRIKQYYWGSPTTTGMADKIKASAAQRGVSDSPALQNQMLKMGQEESGRIGDLATTMAVKEAEFGEAGRQNWLQQLAGLAGLQVPGSYAGDYTKTGSSGVSSSGVQDLTSQLTQMLQGDTSTDLDDLLKMYNKQTAQDSVLDAGSTAPSSTAGGGATAGGSEAGAVTAPAGAIASNIGGESAVNAAKTGMDAWAALGGGGAVASNIGGASALNAAQTGMQAWQGAQGGASAAGAGGMGLTGAGLMAIPWLVGGLNKYLQDRNKGPNQKIGSTTAINQWRDTAYNVAQDLFPDEIGDLDAAVLKYAPAVRGEEFDQFSENVNRSGALEAAKAAQKAVLDKIADRLTGGDAGDFASQLINKYGVENNIFQQATGVAGGQGKLSDIVSTIMFQSEQRGDKGSMSAVEKSFQDAGYKLVSKKDEGLYNKAVEQIYGGVFPSTGPSPYLIVPTTLEGGGK